jgi:hypothetical protein
MLRVDELRKGQNQIYFSLAVLEAARLQPKPGTRRQTLSITETPFRPQELNVSGPQVLVGFVSALACMGVFVWALVRLWLFGG